MHETLACLKFEKDVAALSDVAASHLSLRVNSRAFPILDVTVLHEPPVRLRFHADNFNEDPPSIAILTPDGEHWVGPWPPGSVFNAGPHSNTGRGFICMRGSREYHTHSGHTNDVWANYRDQEGMGLVGILFQLVTVWREGFPK